MATRAADVPSTHQWQNDPFGGNSRTWGQWIRGRKTAIGFGIAAGALLAGWLIRDQHWLSAERGLGYALGIVSMSCMLILLLYPLRKRFKALKFIGPLPKWFRNHMILGVSAPITALYHCNYHLGSLNSRIALFSAITVASSGLIGRFIYSKIHHGLYGRKANLKELLAQVKVSTPGVGRLGTFIPELNRQMTAFDREVLVPPKGLLQCVKLPFVLAVKTRMQYRRLMRFTRLTLEHQASKSSVVAEHRARLIEIVDNYIRNHLYHVQRVATFTAYDRLFALWHKVHFPFFVLLFISVTIHVAVVHLY